MPRTKEKALWIATETAYATDPSADGSGYAAVPANVGFFSDDLEQLETNWDTGRNFPTAPIIGADGWTLPFSVPLIGLASAAGNGTDASTVAADWLHAILLHIHGATYTTEGIDIASIPDATGMVIGSGDPYDVQDIVCLHETGVPNTARSQLSVVTADNGTQDYDVAPGWTDFGTNPPTSAAISYGCRGFTPTSTGGATDAFVYQQGSDYYTLLGGRCTSAVAEIVAGKKAMLNLTFSGDTVVDETKGSLPDAIAAPAVTPIVGLRSPVWFNGTRYATRKVTIDYGITASVVEATEGAQGRAGHESISQIPKVMIEPEYTDAFLDIRRGITQGRLLVQAGGGILAGGAINAFGFHMANAYAAVANPQDESGRVRQGVTFQLADVLEVSNAAARAFQSVRF